MRDKVLVTGSNGFLGPALVERLAAHGGSDIRCMVRTGSKLGRLDAVRRRWPDAAITNVVGSLASVDAAFATLQDIDVVYHLAASLSGAPMNQRVGSAKRPLFSAHQALTLATSGQGRATSSGTATSSSSGSSLGPSSNPSGGGTSICSLLKSAPVTSTNASAARRASIGSSICSISQGT